MRIVFVLLFLIFSLSFSFDLYTTAMNAYNVGDYARALELFEKLLKENPRVEELDPYVKLKMGICAYAIGDMSKARTYLSLFPENVISEELLKKLQVSEEEWRKYLKPAQIPPGSPTPVRKRVSPFFSVLVSVFAFLGTFLLMRLTGMKKSAKPSLSQEPKTETHGVTIPEGLSSTSVGSPQPTVPSEFESQIRVIEELLGKISREEREEEEVLVVEEEDLLKKASLFLETTEEIPEDIPASELSLDPSAIFEELEGKEEYSEEDVKKLVKALKVMLREGK